MPTDDDEEDDAPPAARGKPDASSSHVDEVKAPTVIIYLSDTDESADTTGSTSAPRAKRAKPVTPAGQEGDEDDEPLVKRRRRKVPANVDA